MIKVKIRNESSNPLPTYQTKGSAGMDICSRMDVTMKPGDRQLIPTGLLVEIPVGYEIQVRPRSGLAFKSQVTVLNSPGTIDSDYRGEIGVILINHGNKDFVVSGGDRIAQLVLQPVFQMEFEEAEELNETERGTGGFGSTGVS